MSTYYKNLKWILTGSEEESPSIIITNQDHNSDSDSEYEKVKDTQKNTKNTESVEVSSYDELNYAGLCKTPELEYVMNCVSPDPNSDSGSEQNSECSSIQYANTNPNPNAEHLSMVYHGDNLIFNPSYDAYNKLYSEMVEQEQIVRERLNSDTLEKIKANCEEYIDSDIQIIRDFANVMNTFTHIKEKLHEFELNINQFESDMSASKLIQCSTNTELDTKLVGIENKLSGVIDMVDKINSNSNEFMNKIIHLENLIKTHETNREQILLKLEKYDIFQKEIKENKLNRLFGYQNYYNYLKYFGCGIGLSLCAIVGYKYFGK